jgi:hypothetical protein
MALPLAAFLEEEGEWNRLRRLRSDTPQEEGLARGLG